jgi:protein-tyrosine phosphatase
MTEKLYCYLCGMEDPVKGSPLCGDCKDHMPADTQLEDWLDPTVVAAFLKEDKPAAASSVTTSFPSQSTKKPASSGSTYSGKDWQSYGTETGTTYRKPCPHPGTKPLFKIGAREFAAANSGGISTGERSAQAVIDCAGVASRTRSLFVEGTNKYKVLNDDSERDLIRLHWQDMGVPPVGRKFWRKLVKMLPEGRTVACCIGGHGRTGTCLASILVANDRMTGDEAIDFIREYHCDRAIETTGQEQYIRSLQTKAQEAKNHLYLEQFIPEVVEEESKVLPFEEEDESVGDSPLDSCGFCETKEEEDSCLACGWLRDKDSGPCSFCDGDPCNRTTTACLALACCEECGLLNCPEVCPNFEGAPFLNHDDEDGVE